MADATVTLERHIGTADFRVALKEAGRGLRYNNQDAEVIWFEISDAGVTLPITLTKVTNPTSARVYSVTGTAVLTGVTFVRNSATTCTLTRTGGYAARTLVIVQGQQRAA